tara:strand:+ start:5263 stop:7611 length:2349 start_codon:yes stop_codon:yes gene_type:complete
MAKKATLTPVTDIPLNAGAINTQLNAINNKLDNTLSLDGSTPNAINADVDMNSNDILNAKNIYTTNITVGGVSLAASVSATAADAAATAADRAAVEGITADVLFESELASVAAVKATTGTFLVADQSKLDGIEALADVTDVTNVTAAGALMDSEVSANLKTLVLPASTTISTFGASLVDDLTNTAARTTLGLGTAATTASTAYATAAQGTTADAALPKAGGAMTGAITTNSTFDGRDVAADGVTLDALDAQYDADRVVYSIIPAVPSRVGAPTWFPATGAPYLNTIISADGPGASDTIWRSVLIGDSIASEVAAMSQAVAVGNGAMRFSGTSDATTAIGSLSLQWLGLTLAGGEDNSDAMVRTRHDFVTDNRLDDVLWDKYGLETALPGTRTKLDAVVIPTVASSLEGNTAVGRNSGLHIVKGYDNTLVGRNALAHGFDSTENVAIGNRALRDGALANQNVAVGTAAGQSFIEGADNIFIGDHAGFNATTGSNNLMLGSWAGDGFTGSVSNNLFIGMGTGATPIVSGSFSNGRVGINVDYANHLGSGLHVRSGTTATGAVPNAGSDALVVEESGGNSGISILTDNTAIGQINFADPEDNNDGYLRYDHSTREMILGAANAERLTIDSSGHTIIPAGVTLGTAAGTYAAANTLDDYEEGTFTPAYSAGGSSTATYDTQYGNYTKVGNMVTVNIVLKANALGAMTGAVSITGLPFASDGFGSASVGYATGLALATAGTTITGFVSNSEIKLREWDATSGTGTVAEANLTATAYVIMSATYKTTA